MCYQQGNLRKTKLSIISNRFFVLSYRMTCENGTRSWARRRRRFRRSAWPPRTPSACFRFMFAQSFVFFQVSSFKTKFVLAQELLLSLVLLYWGLAKVNFCSEATLSADLMFLSREVYFCSKVIPISSFLVWRKFPFVIKVFKSIKTFER